MNFDIKAIEKMKMIQLSHIEKLLSREQMMDIFQSNKRYVIMANENPYMIIDAENVKICAGDDYKFIFNKKNGNFRRWGKTYNDDPDYSPIGGEILDIEITTSCGGINGKVCEFCYKSNTPNGKNMSFDTFKNIMDKMGKNLTQIAFGIDSTATANPHLWKMADYTRSLGIIPNVTVADVSDDIADRLSKVMGACAISRYADKNVCYDSVKKLTDRGMKQINIHFCIMEESYDACLETLNDIKTDPRLAKLNAIVLLSLKQKGRGIKFTPLSQEKYQNLVKICLEKGISVGFDSCGAKRWLDAVKDHPRYEQFKIMTEPCESTNFSQYIDVNGMFYPCSFCEEIEGWETGIDVPKCTSMLKDVWYDTRVVAFREKLNGNCNNCHKARECPIYKI